MEHIHTTETGLNKNLHKVFLGIVLTLFLAFGFAFLLGQQVLRMSANDPQTEIMASFYESLSQGQDPGLFGAIPPVDMEKDLTPFVNIYDGEGKFLAGNGKLDSVNPVPLKGVFNSAKQKGEVYFTWSPKPGVRIASIVKVYKSGDKEGYILAGKSLKITQARIGELLKITLVSFVVSSLVAWALLNLIFTHKRGALHTEHNA